MGIYDPKLQTEILPTDEVQQASPSPFAVGVTGALGSLTGLLRDASRGGGGGSGGNTLDYRPLNEALTDAEILREEGRHEAARKRELEIVEWAQRAGFDVGSTEFKDNYERISGGRPFEELGLTPDQQMIQSVREHDMFDVKVRTSAYLHPEWSQSQHEEWATKEIMKLDAAAHNQEMNATEFHLGGGAELEAVVGSIATDIEAQAMEFGEDGLDFGELQQLNATLDTALAGLNKPEGVSDDAWNQRIGKLTKMQTAIQGALQLSDPSNVKKNQIAAIYRVMTDAGIPPLVQQGIASAVESGNFDKALDALKRTNLEAGVAAEAEFNKQMAVGVSVALGHSVESRSGDVEAARGETTSVQRSVAGYGQDPTGRYGSMGSDMPDDISYVTGNQGKNDRTPEENLEIVDSLSQNLTPGSMSVATLGNTLLALSDQTYNATVGIQGDDGRHFDGVQIKSVFGGKYSAAAEAVARGNPAMAAQAYNAGVLALRAQTERSRQDTYATISENQFLRGLESGGTIVDIDLNEQAVFDRMVERQGPQAAQEFDAYAKSNGGYLAVLSGDVPEDLIGTPEGSMIKLAKNMFGSHADAANRLGKQVADELWMEGRADFMTQQWRRHADAAGLFRAQASGPAPDVLGKFGFDAAKIESENGLPEGYLNRIVMIESRGNPNAVSPTGASGLFQFTRGTWADFGSGDRFDPNANIEGGVALSIRNMSTLTEALGRKPQGWELYVAHQQGAKGAIGLLRNPNMNVIDALATVGLTREEAIRNVSVNNGNVNGTAGEFLNKWKSTYSGAGNLSVRPSTARPAPSTDAAVAEAMEDDTAAPEASPRPEVRPVEVVQTTAPEASPRPEERPFQPTEEQRQGLRDMGLGDREIDFMLRGLAEDEANEIILKLVQGRNADTEAEE